MTGLRDRKKQDTRHRIIRAAAELFATEGLDGTTIEEVAAAADVSVGTVYNYFGTKTALLLAGMEEDADEMVTQGATVLARPGANPAKAVQRLFGIYLDEFTSWDRRLLREVIGATFQRGADTDLTRELVHLDEKLIAQLVTLLSGFADQGRLHPGVAPQDAAMLLYSALMAQLFIYLSIDGFDAAALHEQTARQVDIAFRGLAAPEQKAKR